MSNFTQDSVVSERMPREFPHSFDMHSGDEFTDGGKQ